MNSFLRPLGTLLGAVFLGLVGFHALASNEVIRIARDATKFSVANDEYYEFNIPIGYDHSTEQISFRFLPRVTLRVHKNKKGEKEVVGYIVHSYNDAEGRGWSNYQIFEKRGHGFTLTGDGTVNPEKKQALPAGVEAQLNKFYSGNLELPVEGLASQKSYSGYDPNVGALDLLNGLQKGPYREINSKLLERLSLKESSIFPDFLYPKQQEIFNDSFILETLLAGKGGSSDYKSALEKLAKDGKSVDSFLNEVSDPKFMDKNWSDHKLLNDSLRVEEKAFNHDKMNHFLGN